MKAHFSGRSRGFTLLETVIAIGVLAVLLTGFMVVFAPAADGIRKSINVQQADRMASALEQELVTLRAGEQSADIKTGFDKAFDRIKQSGATNPSDALFAYQYRAKMPMSKRTPDDGTSAPEPKFDGKPGEAFVVVPMVRRRSDPKFKEDLEAVEGAVYLVKCSQLVFNGGQLIATTDPGTIKNPKPNSSPADSNYKPGPFTKAAEYPEAVIAFAAEFYQMPAKTMTYFNGAAFSSNFPRLKNPVFTRNLAVRR
jgi:prepilin-type N-terminal cleavage/methylation domain-containing protein